MKNTKSNDIPQQYIGGFDDKKPDNCISRWQASESCLELIEYAAHHFHFAQSSHQLNS